MTGMRWHPHGYGGRRRNPDEVKREGWLEEDVERHEPIRDLSVGEIEGGLGIEPTKPRATRCGSAHGCSRGTGRETNAEPGRPASGDTASQRRWTDLRQGGGGHRRPLQVLLGGHI